MSLSPLSCDLMGWRGAGGEGASDISVESHSNPIRTETNIPAILVKRIYLLEEF